MDRSEKIKKILLLASLFVAGCAIVLIFRPSYLANLFIVYTIPTALTFLWLKKSRKKVLIFALVTTLLFAVPVELVARLANAWDVQSILPRMFGIAPLENLLYAFVNFLWPLSFYELFIDKDTDGTVSKKWKYLVGMYVALSVLIFLLFFINQEIITRNYWQIAILILVVPACIIFYKNKKLVKKTIGVTIFFAMIFFVHELMSLYVGHWWWPGEYLLSVELFGGPFPLDDAVIWYLLSTPALIGGYEFFMDDFK